MNNPLAVSVTREGTGLIRMPLKPGEDDTYITAYLPRTTRSLRLLSLELSAEGLYRFFDADYGVVAGRVIANDGVGVPNCRVTLFIPRKETPVLDNPLDAWVKRLEDEIYPFDSVTDEDSSGRRYNLLPAQSRIRGFNNFPPNEFGLGATPKTPVGTFFEKEELLTNKIFFDVYDKYYRFTTVTNLSGDYLIPGVPTGTYTIHLDADLTDLGQWSMPPAILTQVLGYSSGSFEDDGLRITPSTDLGSMDHLVQINETIIVQPLWTQRRNPDITNGGLVGITRHDFKFPVRLRPSATIAGAAMTMGAGRWWGDNVTLRFYFGWRNICFGFGDGCQFTDPCRSGIRFKPNLKISFKRLSFSFKPCLNVQIANILPFFRFEITDNYCRLGGGRYDESPFAFKYLGNTCSCDSEINETQVDALSDAINLKSHRNETVKFKLFDLDPNQLSDTEAETIRASIEANGVNINVARDLGSLLPALSQASDPSDVTGLWQTRRTGTYAEVTEQGQFALLVPTNRRLMITSEDGNLVDSPDPSRGVFTEWRGALWASGTESLDNPPTRDLVGRLRFRVPMRFDYDRNPTAFLLDHQVFKAGKFYTISQFLPVRHADWDPTQEETPHFNGKEPGSGIGLADLGQIAATGGGVVLGLGVAGTLGSTDESGWEYQTGLILNTEHSSDNEIAPLGGWRDRLPANHFTFLGEDPDTSYNAGTTAVEELGVEGFTQDACGDAQPFTHDYDSLYPSDPIPLDQNNNPLNTTPLLPEAPVAVIDPNPFDLDPTLPSIPMNRRWHGGLRMFSLLFETTDGNDFEEDRLVNNVYFLGDGTPFTRDQNSHCYNEIPNWLRNSMGRSKHIHLYQKDGRWQVLLSNAGNGRALHFSYEFWRNPLPGNTIDSVWPRDNFGNLILPKVRLDFIPFGRIQNADGQFIKIGYEVSESETQIVDTGGTLTTRNTSLLLCDGHWSLTHPRDTGDASDPYELPGMNRKGGLRGYFMLYDRDDQTRTFWRSPEFLIFDEEGPNGVTINITGEYDGNTGGYFRRGTDSLSTVTRSIGLTANGPFFRLEPLPRVFILVDSNGVVVANRIGDGNLVFTPTIPITTTTTFQLQITYAYSLLIGSITTPQVKVFNRVDSITFVYPIYVGIFSTNDPNTEVDDLMDLQTIIEPLTGNYSLDIGVESGDYVHMFLPINEELSAILERNTYEDVTLDWTQVLVDGGRTEGTDSSVPYLHVYTNDPASTTATLNLALQL